jgi:hypothetical protein
MTYGGFHRHEGHQHERQVMSLQKSSRRGEKVSNNDCISRTRTPLEPLKCNALMKACET